MSKRREAMRVAGWLAVLWGFLSVSAAAVTEVGWIDLAGGYGVLFVLAGAWTLVGLQLLVRHERRTAEVQAASRIVSDPRSAVSR